MAEPGVVMLWTGTTYANKAFAIPADGLVLGRELVGETDDDRISRKHARVDARLGVTDLGSRNGTYVQGHPLTNDALVVTPPAVIRTGRTVWVVVADVASHECDAQVRALVATIRSVAPQVAIHATVIEMYLVEQPSLDAIADAVRDRSGMLRGEDIVPPPELVSGPEGTWAVFPGAGTARAAATEIAKRLDSATTRDVGGSNWLVEARHGARRVAITCPPSTAFHIALVDGETTVAEGHTLADDAVVACVRAWLAGAALEEVMRDAPYLKRQQS